MKLKQFLTGPLIKLFTIIVPIEIFAHYFLDLLVKPPSYLEPLIDGVTLALLCYIPLKKLIIDPASEVEELRKVYERKKAILRSAKLSIITTGLDSTITGFNDYAEKLLGYSAEEIINKESPAIFHLPEEVVSVSKELSEEYGEAVPIGFETFVFKAKRGETDERQWTYVRKDGKKIKVMLTVTPLHNMNGEIYGYMGIAKDLTKENILQNDLINERNRLSLALSTSNLGTWEWNPVTGETTYDKLWCEQLGLDINKINMTVETWVNIVHPEDIQRCFSLLEDHKAGKTEIYVTSFRAKHANGTWRNIVATGRIIETNEKNEPIKFIGTHADVTEKLQKEVLLEQQESKLIAASKMSSLGEMAAGIAHEINNPLAIVVGRANLLISSIDKPFNRDKLKDSLEKIVIGANRASKIVMSLKSLSRNADADPKEVVILSTTLEDSLDICKERFKNHGVTLSFNVDPGLKIMGRPTQIGQVVTNLLNNSFDAIKDNKEKWVRITTEIEPNTVKLMITDSGNGIADDIVEKLMQPFFTTKGVGKGTGLGLSISRQIIIDHGGQFYYDKSCKNTRFIIELPIA